MRGGVGIRGGRRRVGSCPINQAQTTCRAPVIDPNHHGGNLAHRPALGACAASGRQVLARYFPRPRRRSPAHIAG